MDETKSKFLKSLIEYPEETAQAEYKSALAFDSKSEFGAKLIKHILGQCNAGGGYIVVGFTEDGHGGLTPDLGLDESIARSYETTRLCQSVDSYVSDGQRIELQVHKVELQQKMYPVISVEAFKEGPMFCCKDFVGKDGKHILKGGAIYIRDAAAKTVSIAGAEQFKVLLKPAVERRQSEILQQVRALLDGSLPPTASDKTEDEELKVETWFQAENARAISEMKKVMPAASACIQVAHFPLVPDRAWSQQELSEAARRAACHNTGWPMGVVLTKPEVAPKPLKDGIRAIIHSTFLYEMFDYWSLKRDGKYFLLRPLAEDSDERGKNKVFFDTRIWDCAEAILHCSRLYKELEVPPNSEIDISITHTGLVGRLLGAGGRRYMHWERKCEEYATTWRRRLPLAAIEAELAPLVGEVTGELFTLFEFWQPDASVWKGILREFLEARI